ncbi:MAG: MIP/aquaporin family protein [Calditrichia bacterium]
MNLFRKTCAEFIGTFAIVFGGCGAIAVDQISGGVIGHLGIATTFGLIVMTMVYATGHISGAHLNPAVTLAFSATRHFPTREIAPYIFAQLLGAAVGSALHAYSLQGILELSSPGMALSFGTTTPIDGVFATAFIWEFVLTFFLMFVIMAVATDSRAVGKAAGLAIGSTVWFCALFGGPISGASMNPARSFGPALLAGDWANFGAYLAGPILGALAAAFIYMYLAFDAEKQTTESPNV